SDLPTSQCDTHAAGPAGSRAAAAGLRPVPVDAGEEPRRPPAELRRTPPGIRHRHGRHAVIWPKLDSHQPPEGTSAAVRFSGAIRLGPNGRFGHVAKLVLRYHAGEVITDVHELPYRAV